MSCTMLHNRRGEKEECGGGGVWGTCSAAKWWFPGHAGSLLLDNVLMKGDRKDSGSGAKPGQLVRAGGKIGSGVHRG